MGFLSNHPFFNRVFHEMHHPFWVFSPIFWKHPIFFMFVNLFSSAFHGEFSRSSVSQNHWISQLGFLNTPVQTLWSDGDVWGCKKLPTGHRIARVANLTKTTKDWGNFSGTKSFDKISLAGGFRYFACSPLVGEDSHFDYYFSRGLKPPTSSAQKAVHGTSVYLPIIFFTKRYQSLLCAIVNHHSTIIWENLCYFFQAS